MRVFELLYLFNKHLKTSIIKYPTVVKYIAPAYAKVSKKILCVYNNNKVLKNTDVDKLDITDHMKNKLKFLLKQKINVNEIKKITHQKLINDLIDFAGIGKSKADSLIKSGLTKISDLNKKKYKDQLSDATKLLMKYKPLQKIPHSHIKKIEKFLTGFPDSQLVGSFRRKKPYSRDIDVMIVSDNKQALNLYLKYLKTKFKNIHVYSKGSDKVSLIVSINSTGCLYYKIDVFRTSVRNKYSMLLYSTGSKEFNIRMRGIASRMGYLLNQNGLYKVKNNIPSKNSIKVKSERDFFNILKMNYVEPKTR